MSGGSPPLWTWLASLALAGAALLAAHAWGETVVSRGFNLGRLANAGAVVIVGDSKFRCGVLFDDDMAAALAARGTSASVVQITRPGGVIRDFDVVFDRLERSRPALVLLQADFLTLEPFAFRRRGAPAPDWRQRARSGLLSVTEGDRAFRDRVGLEYNVAPRGGAACPAEYAQVRSPQEYALDMAQRRTTTVAERRRLLQRLHRLRALGIDVALVEASRSPAASAVFPRKLSAGAQTILQAAQRDGTPVLGPPPSIEERFFLDSGHLNAAGRGVYSAWLADQIAAHMAKRAS